MTDRDPSKASESIQRSLANRETIAPSGLEDSTPTGSGPFSALPGFARLIRFSPDYLCSHRFICASQHLLEYRVDVQFVHR